VKKNLAIYVTALNLLTALAMPLGVVAQEQQNQKSEHPRYKLIYLNQLGGPLITIGGDINCCGILPPALNNGGIAVGSAQTSAPNPNLAITNPLQLPTPNVNVAVAWKTSVPLNLGALPGGYNSFAQAISADGVAVGTSETGEIDPRLGVIESHPTVWVFGHPVDIGTFGGGEGLANEANDFGQVTGFAQNAIPDSFDYFGFGTQSHAFLWQFGVLKDLGTLGGTDSEGSFINDRGQITGFSFTSSRAVPNSGAYCPPLVPPQHPFFWENGKMVDLGSLGGNCAATAGLNNSGEVIGNSDFADITVNPHAFVWTRETGMKDLGTFGGTFSQADAINEAGSIVGTASYAGDQLFDASLWKNGAIVDLGVLPGDCDTSAYDINTMDEVVGDSFSCSTGATRPFLWVNGHLYGFNIVPPAGSQLITSEPGYINDRGEIFGYALLDSGFQAFLLVPCAPTENCEDVTVDASAEAQGGFPHGQNTAAADHGNLTPKEKVASLRDQFIRRHHFSIRGAGSQNQF
jgi:probable HAF family extracellular repeat protein